MASALFWLVSIFQPEEKVEKGDLWQMALASFLGLFLTQMSFLVGIALAGVIFLILNSVHAGGASATTPLGLVMLLINSLTFSMYLGIFRPLISKYSVVTFMKWAFLFALLMSLPFSAKGMFTMDYAARCSQAIGRTSRENQGVDEMDRPLRLQVELS